MPVISSQPLDSDLPLASQQEQSAEQESPDDSFQPEISNQPLPHEDTPKHAAESGGDSSVSPDPGKTELKRGTTPAAPEAFTSPHLAGTQVGVDQMYVMSPQLVPLVNLQTGGTGLLGGEPWLIPGTCPRGHQQQVMLNTAMPCLIPTHFVPTSCGTATMCQTSAQVDNGAGGMGTPGFSVQTQSMPLLNQAASTATEGFSAPSCAKAQLPKHASTLVRQTTVGTNTPVIPKPSSKGGKAKNQKNKTNNTTIPKQPANPSPTLSPSANLTLSTSTSQEPPAKPCGNTGLISQLLGQPSVAPPGSYLDKRNCIVGASSLQATSGQKRPIVIAASGGRATETRCVPAKTAQGGCVPVARGATPNTSKIPNIRPMTAAATRPLTTSTISKVSPILHSSEILAAGSQKPHNSFTSDGKTHTVHVSLGSTQSLAAFPYIQEMVLPDPKAGTVALKLQTAGVQVTTSTTQPKLQLQPVSSEEPMLKGLAVQPGPSTPALLAPKPSIGISATDCTAKLQSLARATAQAGNLQHITVGPSVTSIKSQPTPSSQILIETSVPQRQSPTSFPETQTVYTQGESNSPSPLMLNSLAPLQGTCTGRVRVKRKRSASSGASQASKQKNKDDL